MDKFNIKIDQEQDSDFSSHPSAKAMQEFMEDIIKNLCERLADNTSKLCEIPPHILIIMVTSNLLINLFLRYYDNETTMLENAEIISTDLKDIFMDCIQKTYLMDLDKLVKN